MPRKEWKEREKAPITPKVGCVYSDRLEKYFWTDSLEDDLFYELEKDELQDRVKEQDWPGYFRIYLCRPENPHYWSWCESNIAWDGTYEGFDKKEDA